jgi:hypothetical protein
MNGSHLDIRAKPECPSVTSSYPILWQRASFLPLARMRHPQQITAAQTRPLPFRLHSAALHSSLRRSSFPPCTPPPFTLCSGAHHSRPSFRRTDNLPSSSPSSSNWASTATPDLLLVELQLPSVKLIILQLSVERQPVTFSSSNRTLTCLRPIPFRTFYTCQATTRPTTHGTAPPTRHVVQPRHPQVQQIVTDLFPVELSGVALVGMTALASVGFTFKVFK